ncbi:splicing factor 3A subunit 2-like [Megalobrama amblycephala]|uniref:splicing factor 3A subunit 2-like n=1 Tax=Megalobrama amblycephala TaxID=75352 RepID=UPI002013F811|nr:splicing factor 3A subunit 2-like [Megalobrama amblycephala]
MKDPPLGQEKKKEKAAKQSQSPKFSVAKQSALPVKPAAQSEPSQREEDWLIYFWAEPAPSPLDLASAFTKPALCFHEPAPALAEPTPAPADNESAPAAHESVPSVPKSAPAADGPASAVHEPTQAVHEPTPTNEPMPDPPWLPMAPDPSWPPKSPDPP